MSGVVKALGFNGMANVRGTPAYLLDDLKRLTPQFVLNANVLDDGRVVRRGGYQKVIALPGVHSLWAGSVMMGVAPGSNEAPTLYLFEGYTPQAIAEVGGPVGAPMEYVEVNHQVFLSNGYWSGRYDPANGLGGWGMPLPPLPQVSTAEGNLPPGTYKLCYTYFEEPNRLSGNGPLMEVSWGGGNLGVKLDNLPANALVWITQPNGKQFYLAPVSESGVISEPYYTQPLPSFGVEAPTALRALCFAHGRVWGAVGGKLYYSDEFQPEWFRPSGFLPLPEDIVMAAPVNQGIFVSSLKTTWFLSGTTPDKMHLIMVGSGAIPGTLTSVLVEGAGYEISKRLSRIPSPAWATSTGIVVGTHTGNLVHMTEGRLRINPRSRGAAFYREMNGQPLALFSLSGPTRGASDPEVAEINSRGRLYIPAPAKLSLTGGVTIGGEGEFS